jgi:polar amino acid transport system substrate-binding protein
MSSLIMSPLMKIAAGVALLIGLAGAAVAADDIPATCDVAPTGSLRVAIAVTPPDPLVGTREEQEMVMGLFAQIDAIGPRGGIVWAIRDVASGEVHGVPVELAKAAAARLNVPLQLIQYQYFREILAAAAKDAWDISFMGGAIRRVGDLGSKDADAEGEKADAEREKFVDQGPFYIADEVTYLVRAGSDIKTFADVDRDGIHVGAIAGTSTSHTVAKSLKHATLTTFPKREAAAELLGQGRLDAFAWSTGDAINPATRLPGTRVLDEYIQGSGMMVVVPKNRPAAPDWATHFMEDAKADGTVQRALDSVIEATARALHIAEPPPHFRVARPTPRRAE